MQILSGKGDTEVIHYPLYETDTFGTRFIFFNFFNSIYYSKRKCGLNIWHDFLLFILCNMEIILNFAEHLFPRFVRVFLGSLP